jgi:hypothetical protein
VRETCYMINIVKREESRQEGENDRRFEGTMWGQGFTPLYPLLPWE